VVLGGIVVPGLVFGWLARSGGLGPFWEVLTGYALPLYSQVEPVAPWQALGWYRYGWPLWGSLGALALLGLAMPRVDAWGARRLLAAAGALYGIAHFALQSKGWEYQLYPLALFCSALAASALARAGQAAGSPRRLIGPAALGLLALLVVTLGAKGVEALETPWIGAKARRVAAVVRDLEPLVPPGGSVQVMDTTEGGIHALLRLRLAQPTRFLCDFHFFHHAGDPRVEALRAEFQAGLAARPPAALVVFRDAWPRGGYERLEALPALARLLAERYRLAVEGDGYRIYAKRRDP
jgi:hypothetical protein